MQPAREQEEDGTAAARHTIELLESLRSVLSVRENMPAFAKHAAIEIKQRAPQSDVRLSVVKIAWVFRTARKPRGVGG